MNEQTKMPKNAIALNNSIVSWAGQAGSGNNSEDKTDTLGKIVCIYTNEWTNSNEN